MVVSTNATFRMNRYWLGKSAFGVAADLSQTYLVVCY